MFEAYKDSHEEPQGRLLKEKSKAGRKSWKDPNYKYIRSNITLRGDIKTALKKLLAMEVGETQEHLVEIALLKLLKEHDISVDN